MTGNILIVTGIIIDINMIIAAMIFIYCCC